eukprot:COSAG02_NODE_907_length_16005_cov_3.219252_17_plen_38_part_00
MVGGCGGLGRVGWGGLGAVRGGLTRGVLRVVGLVIAG